MSLSPWADDREPQCIPVQELPTAFVRRELRCQRCRAKLPLMDGESVRDYLRRQNCHDCNAETPEPKPGRSDGCMD